jgi:general stress protein 26
MSTPVIVPAFAALLQKRLIGAFATHNADRTIHQTAVWYLLENDFLYIATSSRSKKARNIAERSGASLMVDSRTPGAEAGITLMGQADLLTGSESRSINERVHRRYLSTAALADPAVGAVFAAFDDVSIRLRPTSGFRWDMAELDAQAFGGRLAKTPGYMLPLD